MRPIVLCAALVCTACSQSPPSAGGHARDTAPLASSAAAVPGSPPSDLADDTSFLPPDPPVDLQASIQSAIDAAATALGTKTFTHTEIDAFVLVNGDGGSHYAAAVSLARRALPAFYAGRFDKHPTKAITVFIFTSSNAFDAFCRAQSADGVCASTFGGYDRRKRTIVMHATAGAETIAHEIVHPILSGADFPRAPIWLNEAVASLYEAPVFCAKDQVTGGINWRYPQLLDAFDHNPNDVPTIDALFSMNRFTFTTVDAAHPEKGPTDLTKENLQYGEARYFAQWMDRQGKLWPFYHAWRDGIATDPDGRRAFAVTMGRSPSELQESWASYVKSLAHPGTDRPCALASTTTGDAGTASVPGAHP